MIFNADSLPAGTVKGNVTVDLTVESASQLEVLFTDKEGEPQTINYFESSNDSVYFGNDDVKVRIVSADGKVQRDYVVKLNVHEKKPDSLYWDVTNFAMLPTTLGSPAAQKTVEMGGRYYTLASDGRSATIAVTDNPADHAVEHLAGLTSGQAAMWPRYRRLTAFSISRLSTSFT